MISEWRVNGFKRIESGAFSLAPLTILAGLNGSGKTSLIQSMLLVKEATSTLIRAVPLNGPFGLELGTASEVLNWKCRSPINGRVIDSGRGASDWSFGVPDDDDALYLNVMPGQLLNGPFAFDADARSFTYLSADRFGPRSISEAIALPDEELQIGVRGDHCAHVLSVLGDRVLSDSGRAHPDSSTNGPGLLKYEVEKWLSEVSRPVELTGRRLERSMVCELRFRAPGGEWVLAPNMGFGLSFALPVILGGLISSPDGILIVENPEAHLHPAGQSRIGVFLAWLASKGVQVVIETHSDHVVNGVRRAIAEFSYLKPQDALIQYFSDDAHGGPCIVQELTFTQSGSLSDWPRGFLDQYQIDISSLGRIRHRK